MPQRLEEIITESLNRHRDEPCYWWEGTWRTGADLLKLTADCEATLRDSGFGRGQRLVVMMKNCPMVLALSIAVWRLEGTFCPLNVAAGIPALKGTLELIEPAGAVVAPDVQDDVKIGRAHV